MEIHAKNNLEDTFIELGGKLCDLIGWRRVMGQVYMLLYISDEPLSLDDIAKRINMSKSTVWAIIKKLEKLWAVNKTGNREGKKDSYIAERNLNIVFKNGIIPELGSKILFVNNYLGQIERVLTNVTYEKDTVLHEQLNKYRYFLKEINEQREKLNNLLSNLGDLLYSTNSGTSEVKNK